MAENLPDWSMRTPSVSFLVTLISIQLPRSGMMRQRVQFAVAGLGLDDEIDAGRAVQLADDDALGAVDDELAAADHDRHVAEIDFFLDRLVLVEAQPDAERAGRRSGAVAGIRRDRSAACPARSVRYCSEMRLVVALDREDLAQHAFQAADGVRFSGGTSSCRKRS